MVGRALLARLEADERWLAVPWSRRAALPGREARRVELTDAEARERAWREARPDAVLHLAAISSIGGCLADPEGARALNVEASAWLAARAAEAGVPLVLASTDLVFDGRLGRPYREDDPPTPCSHYGELKAEAEARALAAGACVARLPLMIGPPGGPCRQLDWMRRAIEAGQPLRLFCNERRTPLSTPQVAEALLALLALDERPARVHLGGPRALDRLALAREVLAAAGLDPQLALPAEADPAERATDVRLDSALARELGLLPARA